MLLDHQHFFVKEQVGFLKTTDKYDIFDPTSNTQIGQAREEPGSLVSVLRWVISKKIMPTRATMYEADGTTPVFSIHKPVTLFRSRVNVHDGDGQAIGYFKSKILSIGGGFYVYDQNDKQVAEVKGKWTGWDFKFLTPEGHEMGSVSKKWAGLGKELFSSADNYVVSIADDLADQPIAKMLLLAATLAIDMVYYEQNG